MNFLPDINILLAFSLAALVLAITPGPDMTLFIGRTLNSGRTAGVLSLIGASIGGLVHTLAAVVGLSALLAASPAAFWVLKLVGAVYLLWLAWSAIRSQSVIDFSAAPRSHRASPLRTVLTGIAVNVLNPKVVIFFLTFLPQFVSADDPNAPAIMLFLGLWFVVFTFPMLVGLIFAADKFASALMRKPKIARAIDWLFATIFAAFAVRILLTEVD